MQTIRIPKEAARAFLIRAFALESWQSLSDTEAAIQQLEFVQEDSIPICGRMHDLILWPRVKNYTPKKLADTLYGSESSSASAFEIHFPNLAALPRADYPYFVRRKKARTQTPGRWQGLLPEEEPVAEAFLAALDTHGPLSTRRHGNDFGHMLSGWGTRSTVISQVAEKLWLHGKLGIAHRKNFERYFDRLERVAPELAQWHTDNATLPDPEEAARYLARKRLKAKALFRPRRDDLATLGESAFCKVEIDGLTKPWYTLKELTPFAEPHPEGTRVGRSEERAEPGGRLLAPLDPLIYDRQRNREIFDFDYTWEVYVPAAKRKWGYYVLPILLGDRLIGRVDLKRETKTDTLQLLSLSLEDGVDAQMVAEAIALRLKNLASFLEVSQVAVMGTCPAPICKSLASWLDIGRAKR
ncbi:DNA glycosylase AlkZ-like family protein [Armatimonas sp.]|uniref:DNA glycosylase AlkZ-like family protein n=1 Tax=Armatimonas sp. TaxID=1872638 RepID=UPI00374FF5C7